METKNKPSESIQTAERYLKHHHPIVIVLLTGLFSFLSGFFIFGVYATITESNNASSVVLPPVSRPIRSSMWTSPASVSLATGQTAIISVVLDAHNIVINGVDAVITYDPKMIEVVAIEGNEQAPELPLLRKQIEKNRIILTAAKTNYTTTPTEELTIASFTIKAVATSGTTLLSFEHKPGTTTGSTIIQAENNENILDEVTGSRVTIAK